MRAIPESLSDLVMAALAKDPDDRPSSARVMQDALAPLCRVQRLASIAPGWETERPIPLVAKAPKPAAEEPKKKPRLELVVEPSEIPPKRG